MSLKERLKSLHESAVVSESKEASKRCEKLNKFASSRELQVGSKVMLWVPRLHGALEAPWEGPYIVREKMSRVNYRVAREGSDHLRLVHLANTKATKNLLSHLLINTMIAQLINTYMIHSLFIYHVHLRCTGNDVTSCGRQQSTSASPTERWLYSSVAKQRKYKQKTRKWNFMM